jgi:prepilin signal peptidase PulO-like enzyme (type II secretory pathway)
MSIFILFLFGLLIGSFANVITYRLHQKEKGIFLGRSKCPHCRHFLRFWDLIPVFSYLFLKGQCRYCHHKIKITYLAGELTMAILFALVGYYFPFSSDGLVFSQLFQLLSYLFIIFVLVIVTFYDLSYLEIPDIVMIPAILIALIISFFDPTKLLTNGLAIINVGYLPLYSFLGGLIPVVFFGLQIILSNGKWMGGGDLRLGAFMGVILGIKLVLIALFWAYLIGAIIGILIVLIQKKSIKSTIPFGPFLSLGTIIALFWGNKIFDWYLTLLY